MSNVESPVSIVIAPDKFKGSLSSPRVCEILKNALSKSLNSEWNIKTSPMADGGEGTVEAIVDALDGERRSSEVTGPLGTTVDATWGWVPDENNKSGNGPLAVIEMAQASGIELIDKDQQNPMKTTTRGTGELIMNALDCGAREVILGIGGSATVDGGMGMARALGFTVLDSNGDSVGEGGQALSEVRRIDQEDVAQSVWDCSFRVACDVDNPLLGDRGAARVYGPQKGATSRMIGQLENNLQQWADTVESIRGETYRDIAGTGAAGGLGFGLVGLINAELVSGAGLVMDVTGLNSLLRDGDVVITGEGRIDSQTSHGKTPKAVVSRANNYDVECAIGVAGALGEGYRECLEDFDWLLSLPVEPMNEQESIENASDLLRERGRDLAHFLKRFLVKTC